MEEAIRICHWFAGEKPSPNFWQLLSRGSIYLFSNAPPKDTERDLSWKMPEEAYSESSPTTELMKEISVL